MTKKENMNNALSTFQPRIEIYFQFGPHKVFCYGDMKKDLLAEFEILLDAVLKKENPKI